jgi:alpha-L-rhamnosidase
VVFGLAPAADVPAIVDHIVADMKSRGNALTAGDVGYRLVLQALADNGRSDEIFDVNKQSDRPGYGYQLAHGATSLMESWSADPDTSQDHFMLGHILEWFYRDLAGIQADPDAIAFERVIIKPAMVGDVTWVKARYNSIRGPIVCQWARNDGRIDLNVSLPPGVTGKVYVPAASESAVSASGTGVAFVKMDKTTAEFEIGSGTYQFTAH